MITLTKKSQTFWGLVSGWMCFNSRIWHLSVPTPGTVNLRDPWKNYSAKFDALVQFDEDHLNFFFFFYQSISWKTNKQTNKKKNSGLLLSQKSPSAAKNLLSRSQIND